MSSYHDKIIIESYQDSFGVFIGSEDHLGVSEEEVKALVADWLNNEVKQMKWRNKDES
jgi:hypothetical protein